MQPYANITIYPLATSTQKGRCLLLYGNQYYEVSCHVVELINELQQKTTEEEAIASYIKIKEGKYSVEQVEYIIDKCITPIFQKKEKKKRTFLYEKELFPTSVIDSFSDAFRFLFHKTCMVVVFTLVLCMDVYFFWHTEDLLVFNNSVNIYIVVGLLLFMFLSSLFHVLGHASACKHFELRHGGIGFGLYLNFPVLYTDVTEVWKLNRKQRFVVNIAGVYFQSLCMIGLLIGFFLTGNNMLRYLILIMNFGFLMTLNPFFKFDGYWIMSDLLGVPNLRSRSKELLSYLYNFIRKRPVEQKPYLLQVETAEKWGMLLYSIVVNLFMGFYFFFIIPSFLYRFVLSFPKEIQDLIMYLSNNLTPPFALLRNISMQLIFLALIIFFITKFIQSLKKRHDKS